MARTTVGAAKATSGAAPRVKPSLKQACTASGRTARVISSRAKATRGASSRATRSASVESISSLSTLTTVPSSPVHGDMLLPASQQMDRWPTNRYCYLCHNGKVKPEICASDVSFKCPGCHELGERDAKCKLSPYHAFTRNIDGRSTQVLEGPIIIRGICERASKTQVCAESILILHLVCVGMERRGSLPKLLYTSLEDYHTQDSLVYEEVFFDFGTDEKLVRWSKKASLLGARLAERNFGRKIIFVTVHSEVNRGNLFAGKDRNGNDVAMEVADFVNCLFNPPLDKVVYASTLFMLTCGHVVAFEESYKAMKQAITCLRPEFTIMFTAPDFISAVVKAFIVTYSIQVLIQGHDLLAIFQDILNTSIDLRMHTDVILFYIEGLLAPKAPFGSRPCTLNGAVLPSIIGYRYSWYHSHRRPWGKSLPMGCSKCGAIRPWSRSKRAQDGSHANARAMVALGCDEEVVHAKAQVSTCLGCKSEVRSEPLRDQYEIQGDKISGWIKYTICAADTLMCYS
ncbi:hypothetical protein EDD15DRAFT_2191626 [Pisolithus albus]|nr:hypothetical protein EDD15DRAFT_2191626 [Pisolithus albus]